MKEKRAIKFYLDESVNDIKKDRILFFLNECRDMENNLLEYYWNNYDVLLSHSKWIDFYTNRIMLSEPKMRFQHYMQVLHMVYMELKSIHSKIINSIYFRFDDKEKQAVYNYCAKFIFDWDRLEKYVAKQLKSYKKKDAKYYDFLCNVQSTINNEESYNELKSDIENKFFEIKDKFKQPVKKELQIHCNTAHTTKIETKEFQWIFTIESNTILSGVYRQAKFEKLIIPIKFSDYHREILENKKLANTFTLRLNKYNRIEIIGCYEIETDKTIKNEVTDTIGIDIGLKKLITCSDGEVVEQNPKILNKLNRIVSKQANRQRLEEHLKIKLEDEDYKLSDNRYLISQTKLSTFVKTDNRHRIKQFLKGRENDLIVMENLEIGYSKTHDKKTNYLLKRLKIQNIKTDLLKYCEDYGINTAKINPAFTSQQCPICGSISKENRKTQETFCCVNCGHTNNADLNASENIKNRYGDNRIKLSTPFWMVKSILEQ
jgi:IS605 OrfB family transposase